jgi:hypothetical protein
VPRLTRPSAAGVVAFAVAAGSITGCGGGSKEGSTSETGTRKPPRSAEVAPPRLPAPDRRAYAAIQRSSGDLRAAATPVAYGSAGTIAAGQLNADVRRLERLKPRSSLLQDLREQTLSAVRSTITRGSSKAIANAAIGEADRIDQGLRRYAASNPAANEIAPG